MKINEAFPSRWIKAADLGGKTHAVEIHSVTLEEFNDGTSKPALWFKGREKALILNKTNATAIADVYGDDTDAWAGKPLELFSMKVQGPNGLTDGTRVKVPAAPVSKSGPAGTDSADLDDDIPF